MCSGGWAHRDYQLGRRISLRKVGGHIFQGLVAFRDFAVCHERDMSEQRRKRTGLTDTNGFF